MTGIARLGKVGSDVVRVGSTLIVLQMTSHASRAIERVIVVDMTVGTLPRRHSVGAGQGKSGLGMIKCCRLPRRSVVAYIAGLSKPAGHVVWIGCALKIFEMTGNAGSAGQVVIVVRMAIAALARRHRVPASQCKIHHRVIELRRRPRERAVTLHAIRGKVGGDMVGIRRALEIGHMTARAGSRRENVFVVDVAVDTLTRWDGMCIGQRESHSGVIEFRV